MCRASLPENHCDLPPEIGGIKLEPIGDHRQYIPFLVAYTDCNFVIKHSAIYEKYLRNFLNEYVAIAQGEEFCCKTQSQYNATDTGEATYFASDSVARVL